MLLEFFKILCCSTQCEVLHGVWQGTQESRCIYILWHVSCFFLLRGSCKSTPPTYQKTFLVSQRGPSVQHPTICTRIWRNVTKPTHLSSYSLTTCAENNNRWTEGTKYQTRKWSATCWEAFHYIYSLGMPHYRLNGGLNSSKSRTECGFFWWYRKCKHSMVLIAGFLGRRPL